MGALSALGSLLDFLSTIAKPIISRMAAKDQAISDFFKNSQAAQDSVGQIVELSEQIKQDNALVDDELKKRG